MTALEQYARLETDGLWRPGPEAQGREVTVSFGEATLVLSDSAGRPVTHWSLAAIERVNPGKAPAVFAPDAEHSETLELTDEAMISAIETVRTSVMRNRATRWRFRWIWPAAVLGTFALIVLSLGPGILRSYATQVVPDVKRAAIGRSVLQRLQSEAGRPCNRSITSGLAQIRARVLPDHPTARLVVFPRSPRDVIWLPGNVIAISSSLLTDYEDPSVLAGALAHAELRSQVANPLETLLEAAGTRATFRLITTGDLDPAAIRDYGAEAAMAPEVPIGDEALLVTLRALDLPPQPYGEHSGREALTDAETNETAPVMDDAAWVQLQQICRR